MSPRDAIAATLRRVRPSERIESRDYDTVLVRDHSPVVDAIIEDLSAAGFSIVPTGEGVDTVSLPTDRHPTREEAAIAARLLLMCNGWDLSVWTDDEWPDDNATSGLKLLSARPKGGA